MHTTFATRSSWIVLSAVGTARRRTTAFRIPFAFLLIGCVVSVLAADIAQNGQRLNVVLILADDLGWTDLGCYGSDFHETPNLDRLASGGIRFTQAYSACTVCSPTRAALLTGKYPARLHITDWIPGQMPDNPKLLVPEWTKALPLEETTLAELFRNAGYSTATIGKWHLGGEAFSPEKQGFDVNVAGTDKAAPPSFHVPYGIPNLPDGVAGEYLTDRLGQEAVQRITAWRDRPFFLYLPHFAVHTPIQGRQDLVAKYKKKLRPNLVHKNVAYAAMVESLDEAVGEVMNTLEKLEIADRTIVIFASDNGGRITKGTTSNAPLRFGKASAYEGGVRVPLMIRWPGVTLAGRVVHPPVITMDLFATLVEACGIRMSAANANSGSSLCDGISLVPLLQGEAWKGHADLFWHYPHHQHYQLGGTMPYSAIRSGDLKLIEFHDDAHVELYDLSSDIGETRDLSASQPDKVAELRARLNAWRTEVGAQMPTPNPHYDSKLPQYNPDRPQPAVGGKIDR